MSNEKEQRDLFLAETAKNLADEATAIEGYYKLVSMCPNEYVAKIVEIIADEKNHMKVLQEIMLAIDDIKPKKD